MGDGESEVAGSTVMVRRLRALIDVDAEARTGEAASTWRDDLRLFGLTWAAGFVFFMVVFA